LLALGAFIAFRISIHHPIEANNTTRHEVLAHQPGCSIATPSADYFANTLFFWYKALLPLTCIRPSLI
jgi:hypothetical protein